MGLRDMDRPDMDHLGMDRLDTHHLPGTIVVRHMDLLDITGARRRLHRPMRSNVLRRTSSAPSTTQSRTR